MNMNAEKYPVELYLIKTSDMGRRNEREEGNPNFLFWILQVLSPLIPGILTFMIP